MGLELSNDLLAYVVPLVERFVDAAVWESKVERAGGTGARNRLKRIGMGPSHVLDQAVRYVYQRELVAFIKSRLEETNSPGLLSVDMVRRRVVRRWGWDRRLDCR